MCLSSRGALAPAPFAKFISKMTSRYERVALLSMRTAQLEKGAKAYVQISDPSLVTAEQVAMMEIRAGVCPLIIRRTLPDRRMVYIDHNSSKHD